MHLFRKHILRNFCSGPSPAAPRNSALPPPLDRMGDNALARFDHDVIAQPHASTVILMMGINDIGWPGMLLDPNAKAVNDWIRHSGEFDEKAYAGISTEVAALLNSRH